MTPEQVRARLQSLARIITGVVGKDTAFVLMVFAGEGENSRCEYVSNGKREDIWRAVAEWVLNVSDKPLGDS